MANTIAAIDESGVGSIVGELVSAVVILPLNHGIAPKDSKRMSKKEIRNVAKLIKQKAIFYHIESMLPCEVDEMGVEGAKVEAWRRCAEKARAFDSSCELIIDGKQRIPGFDNQRAIAKADSLIAEASAAAVLARQTCEENMEELQRNYPGFKFTEHMGYTTQKHHIELMKYGPTPDHRERSVEKFMKRTFPEAKPKAEPKVEKPIDAVVLRNYIETMFAISQMHPEYATQWEIKFAKRVYLDSVLGGAPVSLKEQMHCKQISGKMCKAAHRDGKSIDAMVDVMTLRKDYSITDVKLKFKEILPYLRQDKTVASEWSYRYLGDLFTKVKDEIMLTPKQLFFFLVSHREVLNNVRLRQITA